MPPAGKIQTSRGRAVDQTWTAGGCRAPFCHPCVRLHWLRKSATCPSHRSPLERGARRIKGILVQGVVRRHRRGKQASPSATRPQAAAGSLSRAPSMLCGMAAATRTGAEGEETGGDFDGEQPWLRGLLGDQDPRQEQIKPHRPRGCQIHVRSSAPPWPDPAGSPATFQMKPSFAHRSPLRLSLASSSA